MREWNSYSDDIMIDEDEVKEYTIRFKTTEYEVYKRIEKFFQRLIDESNCSEKPNNCETCNHYKLTCDLFSEICKYEPKTEPQPRCPKCGARGYIRSLESMGVKLKHFDEYKWKCTNCNKYFKEEPKDEPQTERSACDTCQWYNSGIPCGIEPSVCKRAVEYEPQTERSEQ